MNSTGTTKSKETVRREFSLRLNQLLDSYDVPQKHDGRQTFLKNVFSVSQETARKWLEGEAIPTRDKVLSICNKYPCRPAWLEFGELPMHSDAETAKFVELFTRLPQDEKEMVLKLMDRISSPGSND